MTDYKRLADGKREIPISSCPAFVEDALYGTGPTLPTRSEYEACESKLTKPKKNRRVLTRYDKIQRIKCEIHNPEFHFLSVDTDNRFRFNDRVWQISSEVEAYAPKETSEGTLYDMDQIICVTYRAKPSGGSSSKDKFFDDESIRFFDMNIDEIPSELVLQVE